MLIQGQVCLITGAASGIGRATAIRLGADGAKLVLCDKDQAGVDALATALRQEFSRDSFWSYTVDVTDEAQLQELAHWVGEHVGSVDILVNSAGIIRLGDFTQASIDDWDDLYKVNLRAPVRLAQLFAPAMIENKRGAIVNIASASGQFGYPMLTAYSSFKFALVGATLNTYASLRPFGVQVSAVCPGLVRTNIAKSAGLNDEYRRALEGVVASHGISPERVANAVRKAILTGRVLQSVGGNARLFTSLARVAPGFTSRLAARLSRRG